MSHVEALTFVYDELSLQALANNSLDLNTDDETDLGHFLYTVANMHPEERPNKAIFSRRSHDIEYIIHAAVEGHFYGGFEVCRKFHLTEGLCAISQIHNAVDRNVIDGFLRGQLSSLEPLAAIVCLIKYHVDLDLEEMPSQASGLLTALRRLLVLGDAVENVYYYAGHLIELAAVGVRAGYDTPKAYAPLIVLITSHLDSLLDKIQDDLAFAESFYAFAHYRRGIAMFGEAMRLN